ncbi:MAG: hypothetical protein WC815_19255 [Vicinamibacterales bacterium]|jgi:hypothetical protein
MALLQDGLVTVIAIAAAAALLRRVFASRRTSPGAAVQKPGCPGCASACDPPDPHSPSPASH